METIYIEGDSFAFKAFIDAQGSHAELRGIDGKNRWVITRDDGSEYIARPSEVKLQVKSDEESN